MSDDRKTAEEHLEVLGNELSKVSDTLEKKLKEQEDNFRALREEVTKSDKSDEHKAKLEELAEGYGEVTKNVQTLTSTVDLIKKEMDAPLMRGGKDLEQNDIEAAIELQKRAFVHKGGAEEEFRPDMDNLVKAADYRSAARKLVKHVGVESREKVLRMLSEDEKKAFEAASMDVGFFSPEMLGLELDCDPECASLLDLYDSINVNRTTFQYPFIKDYGALGEYGCDASCDGPMGPEGNISWRNGRVNDFRGVFCLQRNVLQEANYDLLGFMYRSIQRSHRINRNAELMVGKDGWLTGNVFDVRQSAGGTVNAQEFRLFMNSIPWEFGNVTAVMHQNMFAYLISLPKSDGGFVFEDGAMCIGPDSVSDCIRISNCLPDPTEGLTLGSEAAPFAANSFLMAAANWDAAYAAVEKRPLWIEQYVGGSSAWCVMYQFGAEDGGFAKCAEAGRILTAGAAPAP